MADRARSCRMAGDIIRKARLERGLTQAELASRMNSRQATVSKLEAGEPATRLHVFFDALTALGLEAVLSPRGKGGDIADLF